DVATTIEQKPRETAQHHAPEDTDLTTTSPQLHHSTLTPQKEPRAPRPYPHNGHHAQKLCPIRPLPAAFLGLPASLQPAHPAAHASRGQRTPRPTLHAASARHGTLHSSPRTPRPTLAARRSSAP